MAAITKSGNPGLWPLLLAPSDNLPATRATTTVKRQNATALAAANARCSHGMDISSSKCEFPAEHRGDVSHPPESTQKGAFWGNAAHVNAWAA
jgi:hypothetical protein